MILKNMLIILNQNSHQSSEICNKKIHKWIFIKIISSDIFLYDVTAERAKSHIKLPFPS